MLCVNNDNEEEYIEYDERLVGLRVDLHFRLCSVVAHEGFGIASKLILIGRVQ